MQIISIVSNNSRINNFLNKIESYRQIIIELKITSDL